MGKLKEVSAFTLFLIFCFFIISCATNQGKSKTAESSTMLPAVKALTLKTTIGLPKVKGGFDLMATDVKGQRLFLSAEDNHSLEVIDLKAGKPLQSIPGFNEPKWVVYRPESNRIYVSTGGDGKVTVLDGASYKPVKSFSFKEKCNNLRYDTATRQLFVGVGNTFGSIGIIDVTKDKIETEISLSDFPKQFELDEKLIYVNIPSKNCIDVVDRKVGKVVASWPVTQSNQNVPMAFDQIHKRLFIACEPGKFIVYAVETGKPLTDFTINKNADGIYYDAKRSLIYVSCAEGYIDVIKQKDADHYEMIDKMTTAKGAGTSLYSPMLDQLFLAVPESENQPAQLRVYEPNK
ncbi:hypothetical protein A3860_34505 [Niastella vici]|uniref:YncE family protein n=1 Tax=Niastella vici TaxID=1703345 RepID=A0A1V9FPC1_9BACT|nr:hypothetical protein [Niastella vici]OQP60193.1 hypothetical protein A3860_34505 [Niastella vici]